MRNTGENIKKNRTVQNSVKKGLNLISEHYTGELRTIFKDAGAVLLLLIALFIYPFLYTLGYENEIIRELPIAVVDLDHTSSSRKLSFMADATEQIKVLEKPGSLKEAEKLFFDGKVNGILLIPENFEKDILCGRQTQATVYCDASYFLKYKQIYSGVVYSVGTFSAGVEVKKMLAEGKAYEQAIESQDPLQAVTYTLYNPAGGYGSFVMPGIVMIILQQTLLIGCGMLGGTVRDKIARSHAGPMVEKKKQMGAMIFGKASAYVTIYIFNVLFGAFILPHWFNFPSHGHFFTILAIIIPFLYAVSFLGLAISNLFNERVNSLLFMVFLSPIVVFISGISWPISAIPELIQKLSYLFPSTLIVPAYQKIRILGADLITIKLDLVFIILQALLYFGLAWLAYIWRHQKNETIFAP